ncbi:MAG: HDOD domain-containing protein [Calditrichia bacterium]
MKQPNEQIVLLIEKMPRVSGVTSVLLSKLMDEDFSTNEIVSLIEPDVSLVARCLQMVNSPFFGLRRQVTSIRLAINFFGRLNLLSLILYESFKEVFAVSMKIYEETPGEFWRHSLKTAVATRLLSETVAPGINSDMAYTAGLLHDLGKVPVSEYADLYFPEALNALKGSKPFNHPFIEDFIYGVNHPEVGAALAEHWNFPEYLIMPALYHHNPLQAPAEYRRLCALIFLANCLVNGELPRVFANPEYQPVVEMFRLQELNWQNLASDVEQEYLKMQQRLDAAR